MSIQSRIGAFEQGVSTPSRPDRRLDPPDDDELEHLIAPDWAYDFPVNELPNIQRLRARIRDAEYATDRVEAWSKLLGDYIRYGNKKIADHVAIFNMNSAHDCINLGTERCQVAEDECYAVGSETAFPSVLPFRRKQEIIWSHLDAVTWAKAFRRHYERKRNPVSTIRFSESGDFRTEHDILRVDEIARRLDDIVDVYTYSASSWLDWSEAEHFTVNQSNAFGSFGVRRFEVVDDVASIPDNGLRCPHDMSDGEIECGDCRLCIDQDAPDVYVEKF